MGFWTVFGRVADFPLWQFAAVGSSQGAVSIKSLPIAELKLQTGGVGAGGDKPRFYQKPSDCGIETRELNELVGMGTFTFLSKAFRLRN